MISSSRQLKRERLFNKDDIEFTLHLVSDDLR